MDDFYLNLLVKKLKNNLEQSEPEEITENIFINIIKEIKENYLVKEQSYDFLPKLFKNDIYQNLEEIIYYLLFLPLFPLLLESFFVLLFFISILLLIFFSFSSFSYNSLAK